MLTALTIARGFAQLVILLAQLSPVMIRLWREWQRENGRLSASDRNRITSSVKESVKSKDTKDLEAFLTRKPAVSSRVGQ